MFTNTGTKVQSSKDLIVSKNATKHSSLHQLPQYSTSEITPGIIVPGVKIHKSRYQPSWAGTVVWPGSGGSSAVGSWGICWCPWQHHPRTPSTDGGSSPEQHWTKNGVFSWTTSSNLFEIYISPFSTEQRMMYLVVPHHQTYLKYTFQFQHWTKNDIHVFSCTTSSNLFEIHISALKKDWYI